MKRGSSVLLLSAAILAVDQPFADAFSSTHHSSNQILNLNSYRSKIHSNNLPRNSSLELNMLSMPNFRGVSMPQRQSFRKRIMSKFVRKTEDKQSKRKMLTKFVSFALIMATLTKRPMAALAMATGAGPKGPVTPMKKEEIVSSVGLFLFLFTGLALLHAAEIAITTLYPWKVKEFAEEEEKNGRGRGVFKILNEDITRVLTTILVTSTASSIYGKIFVLDFIWYLFIY